MFCTQAEAAFEQERNETSTLLETLKGKGVEVANRLKEVQVMRSTMVSIPHLQEKERLIG